MEPKAKTQVTVVIPLYNPPHRWCESCLEHIFALHTLYPKYSFHFMFVNDGSRGRVFQRLGKILSQTKVSYSLYSLSTNRGKGKAIRTGLIRAKWKSPYYVCVDWDFPFGSLVIGEMLQKLTEGNDVVIADRGSDYLSKLPPIRSTLTRLWRIFFARVFGLKFGDTQAGVKAFNTRGKKAFLSCRVDSFLQDLEFLLLCREQHLRVTSVPAYLRGGVVLRGFSLGTYLRELRMLVYILLHHYHLPSHGWQAHTHAHQR